MCVCLGNVTSIDGSILINRTNGKNTGDPFRSGVLKVMSLARFLCATPVTR